MNWATEETENMKKNKLEMDWYSKAVGWVLLFEKAAPQNSHFCGCWNQMLHFSLNSITDTGSTQNTGDPEAQGGGGVPRGTKARPGQ